MTKQHSKRASALLSIFISNTVIGFSYTFLKWGLMAGGTPMDILADRLLVAALLQLLLHALGVLKVQKLAAQAKWQLLGISLLYPVGFFAFQIFAIRYMPTSEASLIYATLPVFTMIASALLIKERATRLQILGAILTVGGAIYLGVSSLSGFSSNVWGYVHVFISLLCMTFYFVAMRQTVTGISSITATYYLIIYSATIANLINLLLYGFQGELGSYAVRWGTSHYIYVILYLGILSTFLSSSLTNYSLQYLPAGVVGIFTNLSPVIGLFAGVFILHETLYSYYIVGGIIVIAGVLLSTINPRKRPPN